MHTREELESDSRSRSAGRRYQGLIPLISLSLDLFIIHALQLNRFYDCPYRFSRSIRSMLQFLSHIEVRERAWRFLCRKKVVISDVVIYLWLFCLLSWSREYWVPCGWIDRGSNFCILKSLSNKASLCASKTFIVRSHLPYFNPSEWKMLSVIDSSDRINLAPWGPKKMGKFPLGRKHVIWAFVVCIRLFLVKMFQWQKPKCCEFINSVLICGKKTWKKERSVSLRL